jgi:hypothetical protein
MGVRGFDLLKIALERKFKTAMLTAHALNPKALRKAYDMGAMTYLPKDKVGELVPFPEHMLHHDHRSGWKHLIAKLEDYYTEKFQSADWKDGIKDICWSIGGLFLRSSAFVVELRLNSLLQHLA